MHMISLYNVGVLNYPQSVVVLIGKLMRRIMSIVPWHPVAYLDLKG